MRVKSGDSAPFLVADDASLLSPGWFEEGGEPLPGLLPEWDPATDLNLYRDFKVDTARIADLCQLGERSILRMGTTWTSDARVRVAIPGPSFELDGELTSVQLSVQVPGEQAAGRLLLKSCLWVVRSEILSPLSPSEEGDLVWFDQQSTILEGDAARFPIAVVDFAEETGLESGAFWYLSWPTRNFSEPFGASLRLLVNSGKPDVVEAIQSESETDRSDVIRRHIFADTARTLIDFGLNSDEFLEEHAEYGEGSVGHAVAQLIASGWGSLAPFEVKTQREKKPQVFEAILQSRIMGSF